MRTDTHHIPPVTRGDLDLEDGSFVRRAFTCLWQELPLLMLGALFPAVGCAPAALLLIFDLPWLAGAAALLCAVPAWTAYCRLVSRIAVQRSTSIRALPPAVAAVCGRSIVLAAPLLLLAGWWAAWPSVPQAAPDAGDAVLLTAAAALETAAVLVVFCATMPALSLLAVFDLPVRAAALNSLLILSAKPWVVLGLASLAYLLVAAAVVLGPGGWLPALAVYAVLQTHATLLVSKQLLDAQQRAAVCSHREEEVK